MANTGLLDKPCFECGQMIKVRRDDALGKWLKFNQDMTEHVDPKSKKGWGSGSSGGAGVTDRITNLETEVKNLAGKIEALSELIRRQP
jgi:hypothetical protein